MFEADIDAGEESEMCKEEPDFIGRDFEKQYACKWVSNKILYRAFVISLKKINISDLLLMQKLTQVHLVKFL